MKIKHLLFITSLLIIGCDTNNDNSSNNNKNTITKLRFIGEQVIPEKQQFRNTVIGGLSSIDYANGKYYMISDDTKPPIRFYEANLVFNEKEFSNITITNVTSIKNNNNSDFESNTVDPEALRFIPTTRNFIWTSEGQIKNNINPSIREININGKQIKELNLPSMFLINKDKTKGVSHNGTFEGISIDTQSKGYWVSMELPLKQDGEHPELKNSNAPIRISHLTENGKLIKQFAYKLDNITRDSKPSGNFKINGVVEILVVNENTFLVLERSFATGHKDGGNNVKIYKINTTNATDVSKIKSLRNTDYTPVTKKLLFDFESIREKLSEKIVDNIEGMTFGKKLSNGNQSLVLVADDNFSTYGHQLNQFVVFEVIP